DRDLADRFCVTSDRLPRNEAEEAMLYDGGGGWIFSGQLLFVPDPSHADYEPAFRFGSANARAFDAAMARIDEGGTLVTRALCMRMRAEWQPDWWNRNAISTPTTPPTQLMAERDPTLPLPPIATARGEQQTSVTGFLAFQNGLITVAGTGNDTYTSISDRPYPTVRLPEGMVPTALASTPGNEFVLATVWDVPNRRGGVAVIVAGPGDEPATVPDGFGTHSWPTVLELKYLGFVELPFAAPMAISVTHSAAMDNLRGTRVVEDGALLSTQAQRDLYREIPWNDASDLRYRNVAQAGFALISSRAENRVAVVDLRRLFQFYRSMYLTTPANWEATREGNQGPGPRQWPYTFEGEPSQVPEVLGVFEVPQPTAVYASQRATGTNVRAPDGNESAGYGYGLVASLDGTVRMFDLTSVGDPTQIASLPATPRTTVTVGPNPTQITSPLDGDGRTDDLFVVARGGRAIHVFDYRLRPIDVLRDGRMVDPVYVTLGSNGAGFGGSGPDFATNARVLTVLDHRGQQVVDYTMRVGGRFDASFDGEQQDAEEWPHVDASGSPVRFLHGYSNPLPGRPFMFTVDEVI
ncbi:MAG: hypothetical protein MUE69_29765, partial [Myxococcota bacterium]|nr:hypothetical protein [Myxococcota bacterium]